ncbi:type I restriction endonuclease, partial [Cloacibacillus evryensis]|uniref:type I restriction endonuclease n=1 Tax=Cloacibacillus evryensis TaxID=508460 RepID=UPI0034E5BBCC
MHKLTSYEAGSLVSKNEIFMDYLQNGIEVSYHIDGENRAALVYLVDYDNVNMNSFVIANQWTFEEFE